MAYVNETPIPSLYEMVKIDGAVNKFVIKRYSCVQVVLNSEGELMVLAKNTNGIPLQQFLEGYKIVSG